MPHWMFLDCDPYVMYTTPLKYNVLLKAYGQHIPTIPLKYNVLLKAYGQHIN